MTELGKKAVWPLWLMLLAAGILTTALMVVVNHEHAGPATTPQQRRARYVRTHHCYVVAVHPAGNDWDLIDDQVDRFPGSKEYGCRELDNTITILNNEEQP